MRRRAWVTSRPVLVPTSPWTLVPSQYSQYPVGNRPPISNTSAFSVLWEYFRVTVCVEVFYSIDQCVCLHSECYAVLCLLSVCLSLCFILKTRRFSVLYRLNLFAVDSAPVMKFILLSNLIFSIVTNTIVSQVAGCGAHAWLSFTASAGPVGRYYNGVCLVNTVITIRLSYRILCMTSLGSTRKANVFFLS